MPALPFCLQALDRETNTPVALKFIERGVQVGAIPLQLGLQMVFLGCEATAGRSCGQAGAMLWCMHAHARLWNTASALLRVLCCVFLTQGACMFPSAADNQM